MMSGWLRSYPATSKATSYSRFWILDLKARRHNDHRGIFDLGFRILDCHRPAFHLLSPHVQPLSTVNCQLSTPAGTPAVFGGVVLRRPRAGRDFPERQALLFRRPEPRTGSHQGPRQPTRRNCIPVGAGCRNKRDRSRARRFRISPWRSSGHSCAIAWDHCR